jgi:hypothetical protein
MSSEKSERLSSEMKREKNDSMHIINFHLNQDLGMRDSSLYLPHDVTGLFRTITSVKTCQKVATAPCSREKLIQEPGPPGWGILKNRHNGLRSEKGCAGDARQKLKTIDPTSRQRGRPTLTNPQLSKNNQREKEKNWLRVPDGCLTPRRTSRLTVGRNITSTFGG